MRVVDRLVILVAALISCNCASGAGRIAGDRERTFDSDWRFQRGDVPGAQAPSFDDTGSRVLDVPHDWSIEDLPPLQSVPLELPVVTGQWRFRQGDDPAWKSPDFDDSAWDVVALPSTWERHSGYTNDNAYGWYRRRIEIPAELKGKDFELLLGCIDDVDETYLNGVLIGRTGSFPPDYRTAWNTQRRYRVPASLVRGDGRDLLAVRVFDGTGNGGIYEEGVKTVRIGPFDTRESQGGPATGHVVGGTGWYRKHFVMSPADRGKRVAVLFEGVYMNADVWVNGHYLGNHPYGYTSFEFELTPYLNPPGWTNVLAVRVRNEGKNSRWYSGSGIYRHVWLVVTDPVHVPTWGVFVTTPEVSPERATVKVSTEVRNTSTNRVMALVRSRIRDPMGKVTRIAESTLGVGIGQLTVAEHTMEVEAPQLWFPETPALYLAEVEIVVDGKVVDKTATKFGIRKIEVDAERGFRLNGQAIKLRGGCLHHDNGPLGAAAIDRAEERRVELLKANGFNAVRTAHNPPSPAFLDACDRLGILVIDEAFDCWNVGKNPDDYHMYFREWAFRDIASMVRRDRNHPSVVIWSIGNEVPEQFNGEAIQKMLRAAVLSHDPTRPITQAICSDWGEVIRNWDRLSDVAFRHLDIGGYNYLGDKYESDHARNPHRVMMGTESQPMQCFDYWTLVEKHPYVIGDFVWTAMDYLGESGIGHAVPSTEQASFIMPWPWFNAWCGDLDICGFKKPQSYYRDVVWRRSFLEIMVHRPLPPGAYERISGWGWPDELPSWTWPGYEGRPLQVNVYSRCEVVRLELNGRIIAEKPVSEATKLTARFEVPYEPGELRAIGFISGKPVATNTLKTAGPPRAIRLIPDRSVIRADRNDLSYVTVEIVDANGRRVPNADRVVRFSVTGAGELAATGSAAPNEPASFRIPERKTYQGRCLVILRPKGGPGKITLKAKADGLKPATVVVRTQ